MQNQFVNAHRRRCFRALMIAVFSAAFSNHALAADVVQPLAFQPGTVPDSPNTRKCNGLYDLSCLVPYQTAPYRYPAANDELLGYRNGLNLGNYGPLRVKFTGTKLKLKWLF